ncbi:MAG: hypothetical protein LBQ05_02075 [Christensenellaceae bacterium]|jgi:hypothetical protein|nr:hypothetical protein [Christensenellaceae bacterium]
MVKDIAKDAAKDVPKLTMVKDVYKDTPKLTVVNAVAKDMAKGKIDYLGWMDNGENLTEKIKTIVETIRKMEKDAGHTRVGLNHFRTGSIALNLTNVLGKFTKAYKTMDTARAVHDIKSATNELHRSIGGLYGASHLTGKMLFNDTFKGLWNAGKMIGRGLTTEAALAEKILYNGKQTVLGEVLKNVNYSEYSFGRAYCGEAEETDFSGMSIYGIANTLKSIMAYKALPKQCALFKEDLATFIRDNAEYVGNLEQTLELLAERTKNRGQNRGQKKPPADILQYAK